MVILLQGNSSDAHSAGQKPLASNVQVARARVKIPLSVQSAAIFTPTVAPSNPSCGDSAHSPALRKQNACRNGAQVHKDQNSTESSQTVIETEFDFLFTTLQANVFASATRAQSGIRLQRSSNYFIAIFSYCPKKEFELILLKGDCLRLESPPIFECASS